MPECYSSVEFGRRSFLRLSAAGALTLFVQAGPGVRRALAVPVPGGTLAATAITKFATPLLIPPVMPRAGTKQLRGGKNADRYRISVKQIRQQILPAPLPMTTVWGYGGLAARSNRGLLVHNAPSLTIEAQWNRPVLVEWVNGLVDGNGDYVPHLLPVDPTLHWANPPGGIAGRDTRPTFTDTPGAYTGPVPIVTHVHGMEAVGDDSDGYAEAWFLPAAKNIPAGYATRGSWYDFFSQKAAGRYGVAWQSGEAHFVYPNSQRASTAWYHDHTLGMTRLNVYAGPAGFWIIRGGPGGDKAVVDSRTGASAVLPGPAPREGDPFPPKKRYREIPLAIQDRAFNTDGSLFYPDSRSFFDGIAGPYIPNTDVSPIWNPEFFGNTIIVNGNTWPFLTVEKTRYRFRILNGCQARWLVLDFSSIPGVSVWQIGNEGGFLAAPVNHTALGNRLTLSPAERADVIVDFTDVPLGNHVLGNVGPDEPYGGGEAGVDFDPADTGSTGQVMQFRVVAATSPDPSTPPQFLTLPSIAATPAPSVTRRLALLEEVSQFYADAPAETLLGTVSGDPTVGAAGYAQQMWEGAVTENPAIGATEVWEFYNATVDAHPMHVHEVLFEVVNRQKIDVDEANSTVQVAQGSTPEAPQPQERGLKDTVTCPPGQVTRVKATFKTAGQYVWHCHIVEHEDNEMMRPYRVGPEQPGQPGS